LKMLERSTMKKEKTSAEGDGEKQNLPQEV
jgi:hypothetical protein